MTLPFDKLPARLRSRKLWVTVASAGALLALRRPEMALQVIRTYLVAQGIPDAVKEMGPVLGPVLSELLKKFPGGSILSTLGGVPGGVASDRQARLAEIDAQLEQLTEELKQRQAEREEEDPSPSPA
tara:strand:+ start:389 stop:769 length:381 start_codon:yes stop_codon:yes gene_type:complete